MCTVQLGLNLNISSNDTCKVCKCNVTTFEVDCSHANISKIPQDPLRGKTRVLNMSYVGLYKIVNKSFSTYNALQVLDLSATNLRNISSSAFNHLSTLKYLSLSKNEHLPMTQNTTSQSLFKNLTSLIELKIYGNTGAYNLGGYPDDALAEMKKLAVLWVDGLTNKPFGPAFKNMTSLKTIWIPGDIIKPPWRFCDTDIEDGMLDNLIHVTNFTMRKCGVKCVGYNAFTNMKDLYHLDLSYNRLITIEGLSHAFPGMGNTQLAVLIINSIENVPHMNCGVTFSATMTKALYKVTTLKEIHAEHNAINGFERKAMQHLPKSIEYINAKNNELEIGFYAFDAFLLENLKRFDMAFNFFPDDTQIWHQGLPVPPLQEKSYRNTCQRLPALTAQDTLSKHTISKDEHPAISQARLTSASEKTEKRKLKRRSLRNIDQTYSLSDLFQGKSSKSFKMDIVKFTKFMHSSMQRETSKRSIPPSKEEEKVCPEMLDYIPPGSIIANLPKNLEYIDISHSKFATPIPELYFHENNKLKIINVTSSLLYCWDGPIHGLINLEYLDLSLNLCTKMRRSLFDKVSNLKYLSIAKNFLFDPIESDTTGRILSNLTNLEHFDMSNNRLLYVPERFLIRQEHLKVLNISENMLTSFDIDVRHMTQLNTLDLRENEIHTFSSAVRENLTVVSERNYKTTKQTLVIHLENNTIQCYCNNLDFLQWIYEHMSSCRFLDIKISECTYYNSTTREIHGREDFDKVLTHLKKHCQSYTGVIIGVSIVLCLVLNIIVAYFVHRFRWKIRYWYYVVSSKPKTRSGYISIDSLSDFGSRYKYDIYIASSPKDKEFVLQKMKSRLENEKIRLFIQDDDIIPGQNIYSMIANAIHVSRAVIMVISEGCEDENEWMIALRMAQQESLERGQPIFSGIFLDHEPGTPYSTDVREIRKRSYMDFPGDTQPANEQTFWAELIEKINEAGTAQLLSFDTRMQP